MVLMIPVIVLGWAVLIAATVWWLLARPPVAGPAAAADPYAAEVAAFRAQLHDWDRR